ncbi:MAG: hypothetical protein O7G83_10710 [Proteobacteria bacterium]|nr:hypothetical protein [Pseudomonadota bacterium]
MRGIVKALATMTMSVALNAPADPIEPTSWPAAAAPDDTVDTAKSLPYAPPRRIYTVDNIGMIIGGASEDGVAKSTTLQVTD